VGKTNIAKQYLARSMLTKLVLVTGVKVIFIVWIAKHGQRGPTDEGRV